MSTDPIYYLMDRFHDFKADTQVAIKSAVNQVADSEAVRKISENEGVRSLGSRVAGVFDGATNVISKFDMRKPFDLKGAASQSSSSVRLWDRITDWITKHKLLTAVLVATVSGSTFYYVYKVNMGEYAGPSFIKLRRKRLAKKAENGGRIEVVVIAGSPAEPLTRTIATDLVRRGYIIYWTTSSPEEEQLVLRERSEDIRPLSIKANDIASVRTSIRALGKILSEPTTAFPGAQPHMLTLAGVIVVPDLYYHGGPVESIGVENWSDLINSKILGPVFLLSNGLMDLVRTHQSRVLLVTPVILGSLNPGFHGAESMITAALNALALSFSRELESQKIPFIHIKMGSFNLSHGNNQHERQIQQAIKSDIASWPDHLIDIYAQQYESSSALQTRGKHAGSPLRTLNYTIFDALTARHPSRVYYAGRGAFTYSMLPAILPESLLTWILRPAAGERSSEWDGEFV
ncbi:hypothetical protein DV495_003466 [Geotrichum candidum]|uniref:DUF1776-domain-containing protein n=1 Tax=Geotrichum candidum TaxID=1173061 RepID=A0A0J9X4R3_GEOCN|nr:hypothetical protein DV452_000830 [Geotrichum candidum]KAI9211860.1 hypothetical protein DS838_003251 [Geotrichum bryndzae]KAF5126538.1 hypothetical protein DV495_003466 [Geotrichum candidum]KAF7500001.1 hypothetical protein DV113_001973 [Geotrichum candidum]KAI8135332.1 hypothetical protein DUD61_001066 [Geotrichum candidum]